MSGINLELPKAVPQGATSIGATLETQEVMNEVAVTAQRMEQLTPEEQSQVDAFAKQINLRDSNVVMCYGEPAQRKLESFADNALAGVKGSDTGEIGKLLVEISTNIKDFNNEASGNKGLAIFKSVKKKATELRVKYDDVTITLDRVRKDLDGRRKKLLVDIKSLDDMYDQNLEYYKELTMYIVAGKQKLAEIRQGELEQLRLLAESTGSEADAMAYSDLKANCEDFEKQLHDLELTRAVCLQTAPQIRLVQRTDKDLVRKIQSSINNTIPIWKQNITIALAIQNNEEAATAQRELTDLTSEMLKQNAKRLHTSTVAAAKEAERGIIDIEAIKVGNTELLATIDEIIAVQEDGRKRRAEAEVELRKAEDELKRRLIGNNQR